ncbi:MAG: hypothetical protein ABSA76_13935, partial [Bacteroidales bacterium]
MKKVLFLIVLSLLCLSGYTQENTTANDTIRKDALNVFMQASDYIKKEIPFINYVRDRKVADVYIISTTESSGSGGAVCTFFIVGQGKY